MKLFLVSLIALIGTSLAQECKNANRGCNICPSGNIADDSLVVTYSIGGAAESATCGEWWLFGCTFAEQDICSGLQTGVAECCTSDGTPPAQPEAPASSDTCPDSTGCDICPDGTIDDDSKVVTASIGGAPESESESATCGEWFLFGCTFAEPDVCDGLRTDVAECCSGATEGPGPTPTPGTPTPGTPTPGTPTPGTPTPGTPSPTEATSGSILTGIHYLVMAFVALAMLG